MEKLNIHIIANNAEKMFYELCETINKDKPKTYEIYETSPRGQKIKEILNVQCELTNIYNNLITNKVRGVKPTYLAAELAWYLTGDRSVSKISEYASLWERIADSNGNANSNYGYYIYDNILHDTENKRMTQFGHVIDLFLSDTDTRQAIYNINSITHKNFPKSDNPVHDIPCTINMQFFIRNNKLHATVNMRSCDLFWGFCNDIFQFTCLQQHLYRELTEYQKFETLEPGTMTLNFGSLHVYERHFAKLSDITSEYYQEDEFNKTKYDICRKLKSEKFMSNIEIEKLCSAFKDDNYIPSFIQEPSYTFKKYMGFLKYNCWHKLYEEYKIKTTDDDKISKTWVAQVM